jgi:hypothetical protein
MSMRMAISKREVWDLGAIWSVSESALDQIILVMCHLPSITPAFQSKSKPLSLNFAQRRSEPISISSFRLKTFLSPWDRLLQSVDEIRSLHSLILWLLSDVANSFSENAKVPDPAGWAESAKPKAEQSNVPTTLTHR